MVFCLGRGADLHMVQLMPLPLTISCSSKSSLVLSFWYRLRCCCYVVTYRSCGWQLHILDKFHILHRLLWCLLFLWYSL